MAELMDKLNVVCCAQHETGGLISFSFRGEREVTLIQNALKSCKIADREFSLVRPLGRDEREMLRHA